MEGSLRLIASLLDCSTICSSFFRSEFAAEKIKARPNNTAISELGADVAISAPITAPAVVAISKNMPSRIFAIPSLTYAAADPEDVAITETKAAPIA
ncbi:hypothetical protein D3C87_1349450 [compost metagenome]